MKRVLTISVLLSMSLAIIFGCGEKENSKSLKESKPKTERVIPYDPSPTSHLPSEPAVPQAKPEPVSPVVPVEEDKDFKFSASVQPTPKPNEYQVEFQFKLDPSKFWIIQRYVKDQEKESFEEALIITEPTLNNFIDTHVKPSREYRYVLGFTEDGKFVSKAEVQVVIPFDIAIEGVLNGDTLALDGLIKAHRIFILKDSTLITNGEDITLKAESLISDHGSIETFFENSKATNGVMGRSGGSLKIEAMKAQGDLTIHLRGENGGDGVRPKALGESGRGKVGASGKNGKAKDNKCKVKPLNGANGGTGKTGLPGERGLNGGNSGSLSLAIEDSNEFTYKVTRKAGVGGDGSLGGEGGPGGKGGKPGKNPKPCAKAKPGKEGPIGGLGQPGVRGADGTNEPICIKLGALATECY